MQIYYGWRIVAICMAIQLLFVGSTINAFGLFVIPVSVDYGLSRADVNTGLIISNLSGAAIAPFMGRMLDIFPARRVMAILALIFAAGMALLGVVESIWLSVLILAVAIPAGLGGVSHLGTVTLVARWFEAQRGRAMALTIMGASLGTVFMPPIVGALIERLGWRLSLIAMGCTLGVASLALIYFLRERPGPGDIEPRGASAAEPTVQHDAKPLSAKRILQMPLFWSLVLGIAIALGAFQAMTISLVPIAQEGGVSVTRAATLISVIGAMAIFGKLALIWFGDRIEKALVLAVTFVSIAGVFILMAVAGDFAALLVAAALLGLAVGSTMPLFLALLADYVGAPSFGTANGLAMLFVAGCGAIGMRFAGEIYDRTGGYDLMFYTFTGIALTSAFLMFLCWRMARARLEPAVA